MFKKAVALAVIASFAFAAPMAEAKGKGGKAPAGKAVKNWPSKPPKK